MSGGYASLERAAEGIRERVVVRENGCWIWPGPKLPKGYGTVGVQGRTQYTHRIMYMSVRGAIQQGMQIDHLCREPSCCNPSHLEMVTPAENTLRGDSPRLARERGEAQAACVHRHPYTEENTYRDKRGVRFCRECRRSKNRAWNALRRERATLAALLPRGISEKEG